jgi:hypothetical protein
VSATVHVVGGLGRDGGDALQWCLRRIPSDSIANRTALAGIGAEKIALVTTTVDRAD